MRSMLLWMPHMRNWIIDMKNFFIITNHLKDPSLNHTEQIRCWLEKQGCVCQVYDSAPEEQQGKKEILRDGRKYHYTDPASVPEGTECILVLGGDGTLLQAARDMVDTGIPLLGINMGKLGYLAEIEIRNVQNALERVIHDGFTLEERMMIEGGAYRGRQMMLEDEALNDIVIGRRGRLRAVEYTIYVDNAFLCSYLADGIIVSTPTGSTGYSLSAGGPIVSPDASLLLLTAISPHTLTSRPIVLPSHVEITVELGAAGAYFGTEEVAEVAFDGNVTMPLNVGDRVIIRRSPHVTKLARVYHTSFVEILRTKMN